MTDLRTAAIRVMEAWQDQKGMKLLCEAMDDLGAVLAQPEDKSQAAFEHWVETVEATQGCAISRNAVADATCKQSLQVEPCNKSCAPGYCYCEPIIQSKIKGHNPEPPPEAQTEAEKIAYCAGWWAAMQKMREQEPVAWIDNSEHPKHRLYRQSATEKRLYGPLRPLYAAPPCQWQTLSDEEIISLANEPRWPVGNSYVVPFARDIEEKLRAKNSTLACIPAVPPG